MITNKIYPMAAPVVLKNKSSTVPRRVGVKKVCVTSIVKDNKKPNRTILKKPRADLNKVGKSNPKGMSIKMFPNE